MKAALASRGPPAEHQRALVLERERLADDHAVLATERARLIADKNILERQQQEVRWGVAGWVGGWGAGAAAASAAAGAPVAGGWGVGGGEAERVLGFRGLGFRDWGLINSAVPPALLALEVRGR